MRIRKLDSTAAFIKVPIMFQLTIDFVCKALMAIPNEHIFYKSSFQMYSLCSYERALKMRCLVQIHFTMLVGMYIVRVYLLSICLFFL